MEHDEVYNPHFNLTLENPLMELKAVSFFNVCLCILCVNNLRSLKTFSSFCLEKLPNYCRRQLK